MVDHQPALVVGELAGEGRHFADAVGDLPIQLAVGQRLVVRLGRRRQNTLQGIIDFLLRAVAAAFLAVAGHAMLGVDLGGLRYGLGVDGNRIGKIAGDGRHVPIAGEGRRGEQGKKQQGFLGHGVAR